MQYKAVIIVNGKRKPLGNDAQLAVFENKSTNLFKYIYDNDNDNEISIFVR